MQSRSRPSSFHERNILVLYDPTDTYTGSLFYRDDFRRTLKYGFWPPSMKVMDKTTRAVYIVRGNENVQPGADERAYLPQTALLCPYPAEEVPGKRVKHMLSNSTLTPAP